MSDQSRRVSTPFWHAAILWILVLYFPGRALPVEAAQLADDGDGPSSATQPPNSQQPQGSSIALTVSKAPWTMFVSGAGLVLKGREVKPDGGSGYFVLADEKVGMAVSVFIEKADQCKTSKECRDFVWKAGNESWGKPKNVKLGEIGEISVLELLVPEFQGQAIRQQHMYAEYVVDGYWADLHLSKVLYTNQDRAIFEQIVKSVRFEAKTSDGAGARPADSKPDDQIARATLLLAGDASAAYLKQDYKRAIQLYSKALELEKKQPSLSKDLWRVVVDNLGMSYGLTGDNKKAKEVFEYGLSKDNTYPMFYYNLACAYGEMNDIDNAITNLRLAFKYKTNMIPGEQIPDPAGDDSFARFLKNPKFKNLLEEIGSK